MDLSGLEIGWSVIPAIASIAAAGFAWWQASVARQAADETNDLTRMDRAAQAAQLHVSANGKRAFTVSNPLPETVRQVTVTCAGMPNGKVLIDLMEPNSSRDFQLSSVADRLCWVDLEWMTDKREHRRRNVKPGQIWRHVKR